MAKAFTLGLPLPLPQSQNLNQILHTHFNRNTIFIPSSCTRIFSSNSHKSNHINTTNINSNNNVNIVHNRRFTSISVTPFSPLSHSNLSFCSNCNCHCFPSFALLSLRRSRLSSLWFVKMSHNGEHGSSTNPHHSTKTINCIIKGRVQGVFYRNWTVDNATELGLKGWVRNRRDGSVEALFSGNARAVDEMLERCRRGPPHAMVTAVDASPSDEDPGPGFERKPTV